MTLNTYNRSFDPIAGNPNAQLARYGAVVPKSDTVDFTSTYASLVVTTAGDVVFLPVINDSADPITMVGLPAGYILPYQVRRVLVTGTSAVLRTLEKVY